MVGELVEWFSQEYGQFFGGIRCDDILGDDPGACGSCGSIVLGTYAKARTLLAENGFDV